MINVNSIKGIFSKSVKQAFGVFETETSALSPQQIECWEENGFLLLEGFFQHSQVDLINQLVNTLWKDRQNLRDPITMDQFIGSTREKRVLLKDAPEEAHSLPYKLNDLFLSYSEIRDLVLHERLARILNQLLGGAPLICNTLNFEFGSQQGAHVDTLYMPPAVPNKMLASWIALEDCQKEAGPLFYYPASHRIPPYYFSHGKLNYIQNEMPAFTEYLQKSLSDRKLEKKIFLPKKGDVFIWHAHLVHGGSEILSPGLSRRSLVTHYFRAMDFRWKEIKSHSRGRFFMNRRHPSIAQ